MRRLAIATTLLATAAAPAAAAAHARVSPPVSLAGQLQLYSLAVPTEKSNLATTKVALTVPGGFGIDSFVPPPAGWRMSQRTTGSGGSAVVTQVTWTGGHTPTGEDSLFQFLAQPANVGTYTFRVVQTYSDGSIVNWDGPESADAPAPAIAVVKSFASASGGTTTLTIVALVIGIVGLLAAALALTAGGRRPLV